MGATFHLEEPALDASRRHFLARAGALSAAIAGLRHGANARVRAVDDRLGPLAGDPTGRLAVPKGFEVRLVSATGMEMDDGLLLPGAPDGMATFPSDEEGIVLVVRNHEITSGEGGAFGPGNERLARIGAEQVYDRGFGTTPGRGGTTTFVYDTRRQELVSQFMSLAGTVRNCAGGPTPWGSWLSCEEAVDLPDAQHEKAHGYCFEVPSSARELVEPAPILAMGRFNHEAIAVDPASGVVYLTEDRPDSLLYRFVPEHPGRLAEGGKLQALAIEGAPSVDTRNWNRFAQFPIGEAIEVDWLDLEEIDAPLDDLRVRGFLRGAARFARGEGMWSGAGVIWFNCTIGGAVQAGQIWRYTPSEREGRLLEAKSRGKLELFFESDDRERIDMCDNLTVAPWGDLVVCEDGAGSDRLICVTRAGETYALAKNLEDESEFAGATFSPDGSTLFVNTMGSGATYAITGPWPSA